MRWRVKTSKNISPDAETVELDGGHCFFGVERWQQKFNAWNAKHTNILTFKAQILIHMHTYVRAILAAGWGSSLYVFPLFCSVLLAWQIFHENCMNCRFFILAPSLSIRTKCAPHPRPRPGPGLATRPGPLVWTQLWKSSCVCRRRFYGMQWNWWQMAAAACHLPQNRENALQYNRICQKRDFNKLLDM